MKIAILTLPLHTNYGGILQAYALQTILKRMGHNVEILQKIPSLPYNQLFMVLVYLRRLLIKLLKNKKQIIFAEKKKIKESPIIQQYTNQFINNTMTLKKIRSLYSISEKDYDAIIVGSDQIWRKPYFTKLWQHPIDDAFLAFTKGWDINRVSYAASFGVDDFNEYKNHEIISCRNAIQLFNSVSVREKSACEMTQTTLNKDSEFVLDPTLLLDKKDYIDLLENVNNECNGDMLCYILDKSKYKENLIKQFTQIKNYTPFNTSAPINNYALPPQLRIQLPVENWLYGFYKAKFIITDSFHACAFAIIFNKPFIAIGNKDRGLSRFHSLLETFGLSDRLVTENNLSLIKSLEKYTAPLPNSVSNKLDLLRSYSMNYLSESLK